MAIAGKFRILVKQTKDGKRDARVRPPFELVTKPATGQSQTFEFVNKTTGKAKVWLPGGIFVGEANPFIVDLDPKGGTHDSEKLTVAGTPDGMFSFKVFCDETFSFAEGNSDPELIIEN